MDRAPDAVAGGIGLALLWTHHGAVYAVVGLGVTAAMLIAVFASVFARVARNHKHA